MANTVSQNTLHKTKPHKECLGHYWNCSFCIGDGLRLANKNQQSTHDLVFAPAPPIEATEPILGGNDAQS